MVLLSWIWDSALRLTTFAAHSDNTASPNGRDERTGNRAMHVAKRRFATRHCWSTTGFHVVRVQHVDVVNVPVPDEEYDEL